MKTFLSMNRFLVERGPVPRRPAGLPVPLRALRRFIGMAPLCCLVLGGTGPIAAQDITAWSGNGTLSWTNGLVPTGLLL